MLTFGTGNTKLSVRQAVKPYVRLTYATIQHPIVPNASHSGLWAFRGAPRLARPGKMIKNDSVSELPVSYFDHYPGVLNN